MKSIPVSNDVRVFTNFLEFNCLHCSLFIIDETWFDYKDWRERKVERLKFPEIFGNKSYLRQYMHVSRSIYIMLLILSEVLHFAKTISMHRLKNTCMYRRPTSHINVKKCKTQFPNWSGHCDPNVLCYPLFQLLYFPARKIRLLGY